MASEQTHEDMLSSGDMLMLICKTTKKLRIRMNQIMMANIIDL